MSKDSLWTHIEPNAGVLSACLPYLANVCGQNLAKALKSLSGLIYKTTSLLRLHGQTKDSTGNTTVDKSCTQRATYEAYNLNDNDYEGLPRLKDKDASEESVRNLV